MKSDSDLLNELYDSCAGNVEDWAKKNCYHPRYIWQVLNGTEPLTDEIADMLGYKPAPRQWVKE